MAPRPVQSRGVVVRNPDSSGGSFHCKDPRGVAGLWA